MHVLGSLRVKYCKMFTDYFENWSIWFIVL